MSYISSENVRPSTIKMDQDYWAKLTFYYKFSIYHVYGLLLSVCSDFHIL
jgi:hypothetical protein